MTPQPRELCEVTYLGGETATLNIIVANLHKAQGGDVKMQAYVARQYFAALKKPVPPWGWKRFSFHLLGIPGCPPRQRRQVAASSSAAAVPPAEYCCDDDNCPVCDVGNHHWCRKGCTIGRWR